jgi:hypothetical protein
LRSNAVNIFCRAPLSGRFAVFGKVLCCVKWKRTNVFCQAGLSFKKIFPAEAADYRRQEVHVIPLLRASADSAGNKTPCTNEEPDDDIGKRCLGKGTCGGKGPLEGDFS